MISHSPSSYILIRACIFALNYTILELVLLCILLLVIPSAPAWLTHTAEFLTIVETAFYVLVYLPRKHMLQRPAIHPTPLSRLERQRLFNMAHGSLPDAEGYVSKWFCGAPLSEIKRENAKEFFCWAFMSQGVWGPQEEEELDGYVDILEREMGRKLEPGWGSAVALRLTLDPIEMKHRPLLWYLVSLLRGTSIDRP